MNDQSDSAKPLNTLLPPRRLWWGRIGPDERLWLTVAFVWCLVMFTAMIVWTAVGEQTIPVESYQVDSDQFVAEYEEFVAAHEVGEEAGVPIVEPAPGDAAYLLATQFQFRPILQLQRGETYRLLVSSSDVQHGVSLQLPQAISYNFQVLPEYLYVIRITPEHSGEFSIVCNEFCGLGHHVMTGKIIVVD